MTDIATTPGFTAVPDGRVLRITITNPRRKNAIDYDTMVGLGETVRAASQNTALRVIVLTGEGGDFCTGADLAAAPAATARGVTSEMTMDAANAMIKAIVDSPLPVIARVRGAAAGIGAAFALAADLTYLAEDSYLLLAFINIGLMPDGGAAAMVAAAAGRPLAAEMALLGERLPAAKAKQHGLVTDVLPADELDARVEAAVAKLANGPRRATELTKRALNRAALAALDGALAAEKVGQSELLEAPDFAEGAAAMLQKRKPVFAD
ncbi:enoyl-CoA hydratase/isomerase family protein [Nocardia otitidiscaviarum]|uniref:enoyl-CoA hydratase-related protein n=1 Tax=Nocardia otitidiscaviarum TaxID=1823 RepID=UPI0004A6B0C9|nr:enoyl-CoA hydratase-related protein [Nocardia otitidiscaviarum]MBF6133908.1 enoyl-CoA hydratase/isomerase family protein [Nocardia otitidiscaviarum]MBF6487936.1 enoyl-CoA hydratase/isomerase family protein [Nocardia otitidiscaviarum]